MKPGEASLEVDLNDHSARWQLLDLDTDDDDFRSLNLDEPDDWNWLEERVKSMTGGEG